MFTTALAAGLCVCAAAQPEGPWSLKDCTDYALEHNISVRQSGISVQQKEIDLNTAQARRLPGLSLGASENVSFGRGLTADNTYTNSNTSSTSFSLGADLPIFQGFQINNGIKRGRLQLDAAMADLEKAKDDIRVSVAQAYVQILYNEQIARVARVQVAHDSTLLEQIEVREHAGTASAADVSAQKAALAQSRLNCVQAEGNLQIALLELTQLLELPSPEGFSIVSPSVEALEPQMLMNPEDIYARALEIRPAIKSAQLGLQSAEIDIADAKGAFLPSLSLNGGIGTNYYTTTDRDFGSFGNQLKNNFSQYVGLSLSIPIFTRFSNRNSLRSARLSYANTQLLLESEKKALYKEIQQAYYNALTSQSRLSSSRESAASAREHYGMVEQKYINGKASVTDYNDAKNNFLQAESEYIQARYECLFQTRLLDFYRGEEIVF